MVLPRLAAISFFLLVPGFCACGNPGSPLPPSLMLPQPVTDLQAERTGDVVNLRWTMPRRTTDRLLLKGDQRVVICRALPDAADASCRPIGSRLLAAAAPAQAQDVLPPNLLSGLPRLLRYEVRLENRSRRTAGPSNPAFTAAGTAPPRVEDAMASITDKGVEVRWKPPAAAPFLPERETHLLVRLDRQRILSAGEKEEKTDEQAGVPQPMEQILEMREQPTGSGAAWQPNHTTDTDAALNRQYRYAVQLVEQATLDGHLLEVRGLPMETAAVAARDTFPPAVPTGLAAVANPQGATIDLSWTASAEPDLAGYIVYRRRAGSQTAPERVSGKDLVPVPSWQDMRPVRGVRYGYSVSAIDTSGNESARSAEASETLPE